MTDKKIIEDWEHFWEERRLYFNLIGPSREEMQEDRRDEIGDFILKALSAQRKSIREMIEGIEEFGESCCKEDELLLKAIKNEILKKIR